MNLDEKIMSLEAKIDRMYNLIQVMSQRMEMLIKKVDGMDCKLQEISENVEGIRDALIANSHELIRKLEKKKNEAN